MICYCTKMPPQIKLVLYRLIQEANYYINSSRTFKAVLSSCLASSRSIREVRSLGIYKCIPPSAGLYMCSCLLNLSFSSQLVNCYEMQALESS